MSTAESSWSSYAITKLVVDMLTPLALLLLGIWVNRVAKRFEAIQWANQKVVEKRLALYDAIAPLLNDLYCFFTYLGNWKELTPPRVIAIKRDLDKRFYVNRSLFTGGFATDYSVFMHSCFQTFTGMGEDAKLRTTWRDRVASTSGGWDDDWKRLFCGETKDAKEPTIKEAYDRLMATFARELGVGLGRWTTPARP